MNLRRRLPIAVILLVIAAVPLLLGRPAHAQEQDVNVGAEVTQIRALIEQSTEAYRQGDRERAYNLARAAYLDHFELVEIPLRVRDPGYTLDMEYLFAHWRSRIESGAPLEEVETIGRELNAELNSVEGILQGPGTLAPALITISSFSILFREGIEVILVLAALLSYVRTQNPRMRRPIWIGAALAIPASILTWFILSFVLSIAPLGRELLEAIISIIAVVLLFQISFWLMRRLEARRWLEYLQSHVWETVATGSATSLGLLGFVTVYREGAETALFYQALLWMAEHLEVWVLVGVLIAAVALAVIGWAILYVGARVPVRAFLGVALSIVMLLSVAMLGNAVRELQDAGVLQVTSLLGSFPDLNPFVAEFLGLHPTVETLAAQAILLAVYVAGAAYFYVRAHPRGAARGAEPEELRG